MSTNTTNTNNGAGRPKSGASAPDHKSGADAQELRFPFATFPMPDPATLERLANEFFLVMPSHLGNGDSPAAHEIPSDAEPDTIPTTLFTEEMLPPPGTIPALPFSSVPASIPPSPAGPLIEADLRAIAASLAGSTPLIPENHTMVPRSPFTPPDSLAEARVSPFQINPNLASGNEMYAFPAIPGALSSPPNTPTAGGDLMAAQQAPSNAPIPNAASPESASGLSPAATSVLPSANDSFSFPRVPAIPNTSGLPTVAAPLGATGAPSPTAFAVLSDDRKNLLHHQNNPPAPVPQTSSTSAHDVKSVAPVVPGAPVDTPVVSGTEQKAPAHDLFSDNLSYPGKVNSLPSASELFSFPGVPDAQSPPGIAAFPSSVPVLASQHDVTSLLVAHPLEVDLKLPQTSYAPTAPVSNSTYPTFDFAPSLVPDLGVAKRPLDPRLIRRDFPILEERVHGKQLVWLDNAATTQKPNAVIDRISYFYRHENSNIHRAAHTLAARATDAYESAREKTRRFLNASTTKEIVFVRGTTEGINLIAQSWGRRHVQKDDEIVITWLEHHANIVPWQQLCSEKGARLRIAPVNDRGEIILEEYEKLLGPRTRIVSFSQVSNALGTITPAHEMVEIAHRYGACVVVDGAQAVSHMPVDVQALDCDFYVFSGHKVFGPTGIGAVYGKLDVLETTPPWQGGGNMIADVTFEKTAYQGAPARFEAGTGNIADAVGLGAALDYVEQIGMENIASYEHELLDYGTAELLTVPGLRLIGTAAQKASVLSFVLDDVRTEDVGVALNQEGIAVRSGHHCAQPILRRMGVESTVRPSLAFYNTREELDHLTETLLRIQAGRSHQQIDGTR